MEVRMVECLLCCDLLCDFASPERSFTRGSAVGVRSIVMVSVSVYLSVYLFVCLFILKNKRPNLTTFSVLVQDSLRVTTGQETGWPNPKVAPRFWTTLVGQTAIDDAYNVQVIAQLKSDHLFLFIFARRHKPDWHVTSQLLRLEIISSKERYTSYTYIKVINILLLNTY